MNQEMWEQLKQAIKIKSAQAGMAEQNAKEKETGLFNQGREIAFDEIVRLMNVMETASKVNEFLGNE